MLNIQKEEENTYINQYYLLITQVFLLVITQTWISVPLRSELKERKFRTFSYILIFLNVFSVILSSYNGFKMLFISSIYITGVHILIECKHRENTTIAIQQDRNPINISFVLQTILLLSVDVLNVVVLFYLFYLLMKTEVYHLHTDEHREFHNVHIIQRDVIPYNQFTRNEKQVSSTKYKVPRKGFFLKNGRLK